MIEIARCANINFKPDPKVMRDDDNEIELAEQNLINFINEGQIGWSNQNNDFLNCKKYLKIKKILTFFFSKFSIKSTTAR